MELSLSLETGIDIDYENLTDDQLIGLEYVLLSPSRQNRQEKG